MSLQPLENFPGIHPSHPGAPERDARRNDRHHRSVPPDRGPENVRVVRVQEYLRKVGGRETLETLEMGLRRYSHLTPLFKARLRPLNPSRRVSNPLGVDVRTKKRQPSAVSMYVHRMGDETVALMQLIISILE